MKFIENIKKAFGEVFKFNEIAGNLSNVDDESVDNQISFIFSELEETITAFEQGDRVGVLDGAADLFVTVSGLLQKLEAQGYDVDTALRRVNANNLTKFPATVSTADQGKYKVSLNAKHNVFVLKDENDKVRKPEGYVGVYLADLIPKLVQPYTCTTVMQ